MGLAVESEPRPRPDSSARRTHPAWDADRESLENRFVYLMVSPRAHGLFVGVNLNPDRRCNFDCVYCDVTRKPSAEDRRLDLDVLAAELERTLEQVQSGQLGRLNSFRNLPKELLELRHVAISGDGEPTLSPQFSDAVRAVVHVRARGHFPFFKIVLLTNGTALDQPQVQDGLRLLVAHDEVWTKLDGGTAEYVKRVNRPQVAFEKILQNILLLGRQRPIVIQSLFPLLDGQDPPESELDAYAARLNELKAAGAQIDLVQIYSSSRPAARHPCAHLPLRTLSRIAHKVRDATGLTVEVF